MSIAPPTRPKPAALPPAAAPRPRWLALALAALLHLALGCGAYVLAVMAYFGTGEGMDGGELRFDEVRFWVGVLLWFLAGVGLVGLWRRRPWLGLAVPLGWAIVGYPLMLTATEVEPYLADAPCVLDRRLAVQSGTPPTVRWCVAGDSGATASSAAAGNLVYFPTGSQLRAIDRATGQPRWSADTDGTIGALAATDELVSAGLPRAVAAFDAEGQLRWQAGTDGPVRALATDPAGTVYAGDEAGILRAFDAESGAERWRWRPGSGAPRIDVIISDPSDGLVLAGASAAPAVGTPTPDRSLSAVEATTGKERWHAPLGNPLPSGVVVADGLVYAIGGTRDGGAGAGEVIAFEAATGRERWRYAPAGGSGPPGPPNLGPTALSAVVDGTIHVGLGGDRGGRSAGALVALDAETGRVRWRVDTDAAIRVAPAIDGGTVYALDDQHRLSAFERSSGRERWRTAIADHGGGIWSPTIAPIVARGLIFGMLEGTMERDHRLFGGRVVAVDATSGEMRWSFSTNGSLAEPPLPSDAVVTVRSGAVLYAIEPAPTDE